MKNYLKKYKFPTSLEAFNLNKTTTWKTFSNNVFAKIQN